MLVTCLSCKKPVFVSSAALAKGEATIACGACRTSLVVSSAGSLRRADDLSTSAPPTDAASLPSTLGAHDTSPGVAPFAALDAAGTQESPTAPPPAPFESGLGSEPMPGFDAPAFAATPAFGSPALSPAPAATPRPSSTPSPFAGPVDDARSSWPPQPALAAPASARITGSVPAIPAPASARITGSVPAIPAAASARITGSVPAIPAAASARITGSVPAIPAPASARITGSVPAIPAPPPRPLTGSSGEFAALAPRPVSGPPRIAPAPVVPAPGGSPAWSPASAGTAGIPLPFSAPLAGAGFPESLATAPATSLGPQDAFADDRPWAMGPELGSPDPAPAPVLRATGASTVPDSDWRVAAPIPSAAAPAALVEMPFELTAEDRVRRVSGRIPSGPVSQGANHTVSPTRPVSSSPMSVGDAAAEPAAAAPRWGAVLTAPAPSVATDPIRPPTPAPAPEPEVPESFFGAAFPAENAAVPVHEPAPRSQALLPEADTLLDPGTDEEVAAGGRGRGGRWVGMLALASVAAVAVLWALGIVDLSPGSESAPSDPTELTPVVAALADDTEATNAPDAEAKGQPPRSAKDRGGSAAREDSVPADGALDEGEDASNRKKRKKGKDVKDPKERTMEPSAETPSSPEPAPTPAPVASASDSDAAEQHYKQGNVFIQEKKVTLAIASLKKCLALNPSHGRAYRSLGVAYYMLGREKSAVEAYARFVELTPDHKDVAKVKKIIADYEQRQPPP